MLDSKEIIELADVYGVHNYDPLPVIISEAKGIWMKDLEGKRYMDMLSAYSAVNQGHRHPAILKALKDQADKLTLTSRAFRNDQLGPFYKRVADFTGKDMVLPMNTGAEAVESALKAARRWAYDRKGVPEDEAEIIACKGNFHGRTIAAISLSSDPSHKRGFGPLLPGIKVIAYGDTDALKRAITPKTAAFLFEPIQGEGGIIMPPEGFLTEAYQICKGENVLYIADEIQTGLGRTGKRFACDWEDVTPDLYILGKALGGGVLPVSCIASDKEILGVFDPGSHGSTFGGNPLACAVAIASLNVIEEENLSERSRQLGEYFLERLKSIHHPAIKDIRGRGLFIGIELHEAARLYCQELKELGVLCKETHENVIRLAPPLIIEKKDLDWAFEQMEAVFAIH